MYQISFDNPRHVYFCGIGGISMSGLAEILLDNGFTVSGSDRADSELLDHLRAMGAKVFIGQKAENITEDIDLVVFTAAIHPDNPEYVRTRELKIPTLTRAELLGEIMNSYRESIAVSGTHGKTTTTSMISQILMEARKDPTISVGGILPAIHGNVRVGHTPYFVAEACEYTNSFLSLNPRIGIILDIDADHLDFFKDLDDIRHSFMLFAERIPDDGCLILNTEIPHREELTKGLRCRIITYGISDTSADYWAENITYDALAHPSFDACCRRDGEIYRTHFALKVPGEHNVANALAAIACADLLEIPRTGTAAGLAAYTGTDRRFQYKGTMDGVTIIDDYAHHPTEIRSTLSAARKLQAGKLWCVFQPHTYSRTKSLFDEFASALSMADEIVLADIYAARETDTLGVSSELLAGAIEKNGTPAHYFDSFEEIEDFLRKNCRKDDVLITMGAGNVYRIGEDLVT